MARTRKTIMITLSFDPNISYYMSSSVLSTESEIRPDLPNNCHVRMNSGPNGQYDEVVVVV